MDERPIPSDEYEPDWPKILSIGAAIAWMVVCFLLATPAIILLWKAALRF